MEGAGFAEAEFGRDLRHAEPAFGEPPQGELVAQRVADRAVWPSCCRRWRKVEAGMRRRRASAGRSGQSAGGRGVQARTAAARPSS